MRYLPVIQPDSSANLVKISIYPQLSFGPEIIEEVKMFDPMKKSLVSQCITIYLQHKTAHVLYLQDLLMKIIFDLGL